MVIEPQNETTRKLRLVLIDGHSLVYRAFFALPSLTDREGRVVNAAYGFTSMLLLALQEHPDRVLERYGLEPLQTVDLKGLVGDVSDNIPGIRGIGEKTAIKLIQEFGSVESLVENRDKVTPPKVKNLLDQHWEQALLSKKMATILLDVAGVTLDLSHGSAKDYRPDAARTILSDLGFRSLAARVPQTWTDGSAMSAPPIFAPPARDQGRLPLDGQPAEPRQPTLALESTTTESVTVIRESDDLDRLIAAFAAAERVGFQVVTLDDVPRHGRIAALVVGVT